MCMYVFALASATKHHHFIFMPFQFISLHYISFQCVKVNYAD